jgi:predicted CoA-binding protein
VVNDNIAQILENYKRIAVVGISKKPERAGYRIPKFLQEHGYELFPVNPGLDEVMGEKCYPSLLEIPEQIDVVDIFRRSEFVDAIVDEAIRKGAKVIWMQTGIINEKAAQKALDAGLQVVMDRCMKTEYNRLMS